MPTADERRRYVRVVDCLALKFKVLGENEEPGDNPSSNGAHYGQKLNALDNKLKLLLPRLSEKNATVVEILELLNMKINLLAEEVHGAKYEDESNVLRDVSLSACGIGFPAEVKAGVDDNVWIEMVLQPDMIKISTVGKVVGCEKNDDDERYPYYLRLDLDELGVDDEESLIQHVIRRESQLLREQRERREQAERN